MLQNFTTHFSWWFQYSPYRFTLTFKRGFVVKILASVCGAIFSRGHSVKKQLPKYLCDSDWKSGTRDSELCVAGVIYLCWRARSSDHSLPTQSSGHPGGTPSGPQLRGSPELIAPPSESRAAGEDLYLEKPYICDICQHVSLLIKVTLPEICYWMPLDRDLGVV